MGNASCCNADEHRPQSAICMRDTCATGKLPMDCEITRCPASCQQSSRAPVYEIDDDEPLPMVVYTDEQGDVVRWAVTSGKLYMYVNNRRQSGGKSNGEVTKLDWAPKQGWGGEVRNQFAFGGAVPECELELLRELANKTRVPHNIPDDLDEAGPEVTIPPWIHVPKQKTAPVEVFGRVAVGTRRRPI